MSETRRQLFRTSILSALGLMACTPPALVKPTVIGPSSSDPQFVGMVVNTSGGWIYLDPVFDWLGNLDYYLAYNFTPAPGPGSQIGKFDLEKVAKSLTNANLAGTSSLMITGTSPAVYLSIRNNEVKLPTGLAQFTWNEIGSKQFS